MKTKYEPNKLDSMSKNPNNWRGPFYFNRKDPRLLVPKLYPAFGKTLNFASPYSYVFLIALILVIVLAQFFL
ncbi:DUF5808 domain-containing protein [Sunxiuqinia indica]|uniref:DUF5808 domain-containing protein n=1 Tax=Sunxiuqinia indica TaxID=2692584 RepID=UPI0019160BC3|nr:DUF5808 domain-containing protein [Sunxiuqinia indica]